MADALSSTDEVIILGAGLAGLSAAYYLEQKGIRCRIIEKEGEAGGLCRSQKIGGFTFDYGGHLLHFRHKNRGACEFLKKRLKTDLTEYKRNSYIKYLGFDIPYPFQANFLKLPPKIAQECLDGLKTAARNGDKNKYRSFKAWLHASFGKGIARHFMIPYNEKFWTIPVDNLTCEWFNGFIPVIKFKDIARGRTPGSRPLGYNAQFYYPSAGGIGELILAFKKKTKSAIHLNSRVTGIDLIGKEITINNKEKFRYGKLISSIPMPELKILIGNLPGEIKRCTDILNYNSILVLNLGIKKEIPADKHWIYFPEKKYRYFRIGFYNSFSSSLAPDKCSSIYVEISYPKGKSINKKGLEREVVRSLIAEKVIGSESEIIASSLFDIKYGYPIYDYNHKNAVSKVLRFLFSHSVYSIGRYGSWSYMSMEDAMLGGKEIAEKIG